jgi:hypothetical protein
MEKDIKKQVINWFNSPQDYDKGLKLLQSVSRRNKVIAKLIKRGETRSSFEKLVWELNKIAGLKKIPVPKGKVENRIVRKLLSPLVPDVPEAVKTGKKEDVTIPEKVRYSLIGKNDDINLFSPLVQKLIRENSSIYMQRGKKHAALTRLPDGNDSETILKRTALMDSINEMTARLEVLFEAWNLFKKSGIEPNPDELWPEESSKAVINTAQVSVDELKTLKKNIQSSVTKDRNLLLYGSKTRQEKEDPMPAGPKRTKLEKRIAKKEAEIIQLDQQIADLG